MLLLAEQGLGDAIQFVRYAPLVAALGAKVLLGVQPSAHCADGNRSGRFAGVSDGEALPDFDLYCPLLSLPLAFATELATIPANIPYIRPQEERIAKWRGQAAGERPAARRNMLGRHQRASERPQSLDTARSLCRDAVGVRPRFRQRAKRSQRGAGGDAARAWRRSAWPRVRGFFRHRCGRRDARSHYRGRYFGCASCRRDGQGGRPARAVLAGFAGGCWIAPTAPGIRPCACSGKPRSAIGTVRSSGCAKNLPMSLAVRRSRADAGRAARWRYSMRLTASGRPCLGLGANVRPDAP